MTGKILDLSKHVRSAYEINAKAHAEKAVVYGKIGDRRRFIREVSRSLDFSALENLPEEQRVVIEALMVAFDVTADDLRPFIQPWRGAAKL